MNYRDLATKYQTLQEAHIQLCRENLILTRMLDIIEIIDSDMVVKAKDMLKAKGKLIDEFEWVE